MFRSRIASVVTHSTRLSRRTLASEAVQSQGSSTSSEQSKSTQTEIADLPPNVLAAYLEPGRVPVTHNVPACQLHLRSYDKEAIQFFADFAMRAAYHLNLPAKGPVPMPRKTERWTVIRGPFVHKKTQENFERITYKRMIKIADGHPEVVERWLSYLNANVMAGVGMKANTYSFDSVGVGKRMQEAKNRAAIGGAPQEEREIPNLAAEKAKKILAGKEYRDPNQPTQLSAETSKSSDNVETEMVAETGNSVETKSNVETEETTESKNKVETENNAELENKPDTERLVETENKPEVKDKVETATEAASATKNNVETEKKVEAEQSVGTENNVKAKKSAKAKKSVKAE